MGPDQFCSLAVLDPRVGHTMDILSPFMSVILIDSSMGSPVHVSMLSIQAIPGLPRLRASGIIPCIIAFSRQLPCFLMQQLNTSAHSVFGSGGIIFVSVRLSSCMCVCTQCKHSSTGLPPTSSLVIFRCSSQQTIQRNEIFLPGVVSCWMKQRRCLGGTLLSYKPLNRVLTGPEKS